MYLSIYLSLLINLSLSLSLSLSHTHTHTHIYTLSTYTHIRKHTHIYTYDVGTSWSAEYICKKMRVSKYHGAQRARAVNISTASLHRGRTTSTTSVLDLIQKHLMICLQFWNVGECGVPLRCHYSQVNSDSEFKYLFGSYLWVYSIITNHKFIYNARITGFALNKPQGLICHTTTKENQTNWLKHCIYSILCLSTYWELYINSSNYTYTNTE